MIARVINWLILAFVVVAYQGLLVDYFAPEGAGLQLGLLLIVMAGLTGGTTRGLIAGGIVGFLTDCLTPQFLGWGLIVKVCLGGATGAVRERLFMDRIVAQWMIIAAALLAHDLIYLLPVTNFDLSRYLATLWSSTLFSTLVTSVLGALYLAYIRARQKPAMAVADDTDER